MPTFVPGRELQLVARHTRPDDLADQVRLDAEVREGLEQRLGGALDRLLGLALLGVGARALEDARVGKLVAGVLRRGHVEDGRGPLGELRLEVVELVDEDGGRLGVLPHDIGIRRGAVHGRRVRLRDRLVFERDADAFDGAARGHSRLLRRAGRVADERAERCAGDEQRSRDDEEEAQDGGARVAEEAAEDEVQRLAGAPPARFAQDGHHAEAEDDEAGPERPHVDQLGAGDQEAADGEQDEWDSDAPGADESIEGGVDPVAGIAPVPAEPERNGEEDAQEDECEPEKLVVLLPPGALRPRALLPAHAGRGLRA